MDKVIIEKRKVYEYPKTPPFRPSIIYPEAISTEVSAEENQVYDMVRACFNRAGYDASHYGKKSWNPLGDLINPGDNVLLKPNLVMDVNPNGKGEDCLYTQPSVVAAVLDYVCIALQGKGHIIVGDAPMQECKFDELIEKSGYAKLVRWCNENFKGITVELLDFRGLSSTVVNGIHHYKEAKQSGIVVELGSDSEFAKIDKYREKNIRITNYNPDLLKQHHNKDKHEYFVSKYVLNADVIINMPKPKTHRKAGVTIAMKNLVGINTRKEYLPHHTNGSIAEGGDEYLNKSWAKRQRAICLDYTNKAAQKDKNERTAKFWSLFSNAWSLIARLTAKDRYSEGSWYGNHTISKTILDLNKILFYADTRGKMRDVPQRRYMIVADMIISGEKEGPVVPSPKKVGIIATGENPVTFDITIGTMMGADINRIPTLSQLKEYSGKYMFNYNNSSLILSNDESLNGKTVDKLSDGDLLYFEPTSGWSEVFRKQIIKAGV